MFTGFVIWTIIAFAGGLIVGWNLLPQPEFIRKLYEKVTD
jgi:hypothetical protein